MKYLSETLHKIHDSINKGKELNELDLYEIRKKLIDDFFGKISDEAHSSIANYLNYKKKEQYKKFHCTHCGKSTIIDVA